MIFFGSNKTEIAAGELAGVICVNCGSVGTVEAHIYSKYAHVYWIPVFPIGKWGLTSCSFCKQAFEASEAPASYHEAYLAVKDRAKVPLKHYAGLILLGILIVWGVFARKMKSEEDSKFLDAPQAGDVYQLKTNSGNYTLLKIARVTPDTTFFFVNRYEVNKISGLNKSDVQSKESFMLDSEVGIDKAHLRSWLATDTILAINRD